MLLIFFVLVAPRSVTAPPVLWTAAPGFHGPENQIIHEAPPVVRWRRYNFTRWDK